jgi:hypothetical protein
MNHSMYGADRLTHLKIVVVALIGATLVAGVGIAARATSDDPSATLARAQSSGRMAQGYGPVIKAGGPVIVGAQTTSSIR